VIYSLTIKFLGRFGEFGEVREKYNAPKLPNDPTEAANLIITLISQCSFLLKRQIDSLMEKHRREGGFTEKLYKNRIKYRKSKN
jgi:four helix bundle suffix protein